MGQSITLHPAPAGAQFSHTVSGTRFRVFSEAGQMFHSISRGPFTATYPIEFAIGSGTHAQGFIAAVRGALFQSPVTAYRNRSKWDVAPGYEAMTAPDFNRKVTAECLLCHASGRDPIGCERCHGDGAAHALQPGRGNIVNPARLPAAERDSVCEQCHLNGEARVLNSGAEFGDFKPGRKLEDVLSVFVYDRTNRDLKVVSHSEQLALSGCQRASGKLWCGTCHQPHGQPVDVAAQCKGCHGTLSAGHPRAPGTCQGCHMPKRPARDGGHSAFTDHRIQKRAAAGEDGTAGVLRPWREAAEPGLRARNLGLAYVTVGERDGSAEFLNRGYKLLAGVYPQFTRDADVLAGLGMVLFLKNETGDAVKVLRAAVEARPADALLHQKLAVVLRAAGRGEDASAGLEKAIALDPTLETAYHLLADWQSDPAKRRQTLERYLKVNPQSLIAREAIAKLARP